MAQRRGSRSRRHQLSELGQTAGDRGIDSRSIFREPLALGRFAIGLWDEHDHRLLVADSLAPGSEAMIARHMHEHHRPFSLGSPEISVCETATCEQARIWTVAAATKQIEAATS